MQRHCIAALLLALSALACTQAITGRVPDDEISGMRGEEPALRRAAEKAQATLSDFLTKAVHQPAGTSAYALRVRLQEGRNTEYFWLDEFTWTDSSFTGRINNEPRLLKSIQPGQIVKFKRTQVVDWKYTDANTGKTVGNFGACALLRQEPPARAEEIKQRNGLDCS